MTPAMKGMKEFIEEWMKNLKADPRFSGLNLDTPEINQFKKELILWAANKPLVASALMALASIGKQVGD